MCVCTRTHFKNFTNFTPSFGSFFNGNISSIKLNLKSRIQPKFTGSIQVNYDKINLAETFSDANILLISPRIDLTFSKNIYWATLVQYSNQRENLSLNTRLQWRFAPLSDLYLVYSDNYYTENRDDSFIIPRIKNRSLNLKLTYWLDI